VFFQNAPKLSVQKLFAVTLTLKIISSGLGLVLNSPWILGFAVPITIMVFYMVLGHYTREEDISSEKFADSCYYIGFIFTMTSIIFSLFDLPNLGASDGMRNIALRFGAAMVSTVLGMGVRVYLVSFRKDASDAIKEAEEAVLDATRMLVSQLNAVLDELKKFEVQVVDASKMSVENVNRQISELGQNYARSLNGFYVQVTEENRAIFKDMGVQVSEATSRLTWAVDTYSSGIKGSLESIERRVTEFSDAVTSRLANTTFPDDFFASKLKEPLDQLKVEASGLGNSVRRVSELVEGSSETLAAGLKKITSKTKKTQDAMDALVQLTEQHQLLLSNAGNQLNTLLTLSERMHQIDTALQAAMQMIGINSNASAGLLAKVASLSAENSALRLEIKGAMDDLTRKLDATTTLATGVFHNLEAKVVELRTGASEVIASFAQHSGSSATIAQQLATTGTYFHGIVEQLQSISDTNAEVAGSARSAAHNSSVAAQLANQAAQTASSASDSIINTAAQIGEVVSQVKDLDIAFRARAEGLIDAAQRLGRYQEAQPTLIADAVVQAMALRDTSPVANGLQGADGHLDPTIMTEHISLLEPIANNLAGTDKNHVSSPTPTGL
jgi:hypothetical protein